LARPRQLSTPAFDDHSRRVRSSPRLAALAVALCVGAAACSGATVHVSGPAVTTADTATTPAAAATTVPPTTLPPTTTTLDPGALPQTHVLPSPTDPVFMAGVDALWRAIVADDPTIAMPFFFPLSAYLQVKAISNPAADWQSRLVSLYQLDIHAAHAFLGVGASESGLLRVDVPTAQAQWIAPGVEYNKGSYYRVYGTRLSFSEGGRTRSFGIFSLISWRGEWYVVHLGPSTRTVVRGIVYAPIG